MADATAAITGGIRLEQVQGVRERQRRERRFLLHGVLLRFRHPSMVRLSGGGGAGALPRRVAAAYRAGMIITPPDPNAAEGHVAEMYADDIDDDGFVFVHTQAMAVNPEAHAAFENLIQAIVPSIGLRVYEAATLGAARALGSTHCLLAHGRKSLRAGIVDEAGLTAFAQGDDSGFAPAERVVIDYAARLSTDPAAMTDDDARSLRDAGYSDRQIVDITLAASVRNYFSRALLALAVPVDEVPGLDPAIAAALTRPASDGAPPTADR